MAIVIFFIMLYIIWYIIFFHGAKMKKHSKPKRKMIIPLLIATASISNVACSVNPSATFSNQNANVHISKSGVSANIGTYYNLNF